MSSLSTSKLFRLKEWLTLPEAAKYLSVICGEKVAIADILRLGLDGHLTLSVFFESNTYGTPGYLEKSSFQGEYPKDGSITDELQKTIGLLEKYFHQQVFIEYEKKNVFPLNGRLFNLPMIGCEQNTIERQWQRLTQGPKENHKSLEQAIVIEEETGTVYALKEAFEDNEPLLINDEPKTEDEDTENWLERNAPRRNPANYFPAAGLPLDSVLVVRTEALRDFEQLLDDNAPKKNTSAKVHGNTERFAQTREQVLGAALCVITQWPNRCCNSSGKFEATKIAGLIDEKALLFWPESAQPPLSREKMEREISKWINKIGK